MLTAGNPKIYVMRPLTERPVEADPHGQIADTAKTAGGNSLQMELNVVVQQQMALWQAFQQNGDAGRAGIACLITGNAGGDVGFPLAIAATADEGQRHGSLQITRRVWRI